MTARGWLRATAVALVAGTVVALPVAGALASQRGAAAAGPGYLAVAAADGVRVGVTINHFLVVSDIVDAGGPSAQALVDAFGDSQGYAAYPYPGDVVLTAHGLSQGAAPNYPLIAQSSDPTQPSAHVGQGPYDLRAASKPDKSSASAQVVGGSADLAATTSRSTATVDHDPKTGVVTSTAETTIEGLSVAGVLHIGRLHSLATMRAAPGQPAQRTTQLEVGDVTVGSQQVGLTDKGLVLAGTDVPLPPSSTANALLAGAGITVNYLAASATGSSAVAPGLSIGVVQDVPGVGETTVSYVLGQTSVTAQAAGASLGAAVPGLGGPAASPTAGNGPGATTGAGSGVSGLGGPAAGAPAAPTLPQEPATASGSAPSTAAPPMTATASAPPAASLASAASLYVVIAIGAIVMAAAAALFRVLAERLAWS